MKRYELKDIGDKALDHLKNEKGEASNIGIFYGKRVRGRKILELVKAGAHVDITGVTAAYTATKQLRNGEIVKQTFYELKEVVVYNRINHARYHRLLLQLSRRKLVDTSQLGLDPSMAMLNDADIARILEFSRGEILCRYGISEY